VKGAVAALLLLASMVPALAQAHGMRSAYVELQELAAGRATIRLKLSVPEPSLQLLAPDGCTLQLEAIDGYASAGTLTCDGTLSGRTLKMRGLGPIITEAVIDVELVGGGRATHLLRAGAPEWQIAEEAGALQVAAEYLKLGVQHIATGADHLLFLLLLVLALKRPRAVILAETAFTLSHSLSFTATALGWVRVSPAAAEACIALSLLLVALDVERPGAERLSARRGALLALLFGLVHGLGFAGGLRELGLPEAHVPLALVGFGAGVELGQIAFLTVALVAAHFASRAKGWRYAATATAYGIGAVSSYWLIQRLAVMA
jgi:hypothetical protein